MLASIGGNMCYTEFFWLTFVLPYLVIEASAAISSEATR